MPEPKSNYEPKTRGVIDYDVEVRAFGFGVAVEAEGTEVLLQQATRIGEMAVVVTSHLTGDDARELAVTLTRASMVAETPPDQRG